MASKMGVIPSKRISYSYTPLEIKAAKRRRKDTFKALSSIEKSKITTPLSLSCTDVDVIVEATAEEHNITVDSPSPAFKEEEKELRSFIASYAEYLSDRLQVPNDGLDSRLLRKRYAGLLWKYREAKAQKLYASYIKDPGRSKTNFVTLDEEKLIHID
ncbi:hypothetical protein BC332_10762 [Capsicum chinense]|nr:hypothetical protein BC332_10762 [Capsicum chinense]